MVVTDSELGFFSRANEEKPWKVFLSNANVELTDYTNDPGGEPARLAARGRFMDSGDARLDAVFRSDADGPDFEVAAAIESTELATLNDLLRATAGFDVVGGDFSLYSEVAVADGAIDGYVKPLFSDVDVYDPVQDQGKNVDVGHRRIGARHRVLGLPVAGGGPPRLRLARAPSGNRHGLKCRGDRCRSLPPALGGAAATPRAG